MSKSFRLKALSVTAGLAVITARGAVSFGGPPPGPPSAPAESAKASEKDAAEKPKMVKLDARNWTVNERTGLYTGTDFTYVDDDTTVTGSKAVYNKTSKVLEAEGNLVMEDPKHHASCDKAHIDNSKKKTALLTGHVVIVLKPEDKNAKKDGPKGEAPKAGPKAAEPSPRDAASAEPHPITVSDPPKPDANATANRQDKSAEKDKEEDQTKDGRKQGGTINCDSVEDHYKQKFVIMRGHLVFKQNFKKANGKTVERTMTAEHAEYDGKADTLLLYKPVEGHDSDGQQMKCDGNVTVGTKEGDETLSSKEPIHITGIKPEEDDDSADDSKPDAAKSAAQGKKSAPTGKDKSPQPNQPTPAPTPGPTK